MLKAFSEFKRAMIAIGCWPGWIALDHLASGWAGHGRRRSRCSVFVRVRSQRDGTTPEGECCQGERGQADVGDHGWVRTLDQPTSIRDRQRVLLRTQILSVRNAHSFMCEMTAMTCEESFYTVSAPGGVRLVLSSWKWPVLDGLAAITGSDPHIEGSASGCCHAAPGRSGSHTFTRRRGVVHAPINLCKPR